jgi:hypothetical protein
MRYRKVTFRGPSGGIATFSSGAEEILTIYLLWVHVGFGNEKMQS